MRPGWTPPRHFNTTQPPTIRQPETHTHTHLATLNPPYFYTFNVFHSCVSPSVHTPHPAHQTTPRPPDPHTHPPPTRASKGLVHAGVKSPTPGESLVFISNFHKFLMKCCEVVVRPFARQARCEGLFSSVAGTNVAPLNHGVDRERERERHHSSPLKECPLSHS